MSVFVCFKLFCIIVSLFIFAPMLFRGESIEFFFFVVLCQCQCCVSVILCQCCVNVVSVLLSTECCVNVVYQLNFSCIDLRKSLVLLYASQFRFAVGQEHANHAFFP